MSNREVAVEDVVIKMAHVEDCCCRYVASPLNTNDVKLIDTRCMSSYVVPDAPTPQPINMNMPIMTRPQDWAERSRAILQERGAWRVR